MIDDDRGEPLIDAEFDDVDRCRLDSFKNLRLPIVDWPNTGLPKMLFSARAAQVNINMIDAGAFGGQDHDWLRIADLRPWLRPWLRDRGTCCHLTL